LSEYEKYKPRVLSAIDSLSKELVGVSHSIHDFAEYGTMEYKSSELLVSKLKQHGFEIGKVEMEPGMEKWKDGLRTAIKATYKGGAERPLVGINAEFDALPQGHGCGHNLIAATALGAVLGVSKVAKELDGSVRFLGSPAEEAYVWGSSSKIVMLEEYRKLDACMYEHPGTSWTVNVDPTFDKYQNFSDSWVFVFKGNVGHGSNESLIANPQRAAIMTWIGIDALHVVPFCDHVITGRGLVDFDSEGKPYYFYKGGSVEVCELGIHVGQPSREAKKRVLEKVMDIAKHAAASTGCTVEFVQYAPDVEASVTNVPLATALFESFEELGVPIQEAKPRVPGGSSDFGNVTRVVPATMATIKMGDGFIGHSWDAVKAAESTEADKTVILGAKAMALTTLKILTEPDLLKRAKADFAKRMKEEAALTVSARKNGSKSFEM
jgi:metal-dependent amidase/aminoacylase/carboxypeptidase family protein